MNVLVSRKFGYSVSNCIYHHHIAYMIQSSPLYVQNTGFGKLFEHIANYKWNILNQMPQHAPKVIKNNFLLQTFIQKRKNSPKQSNEKFTDTELKKLGGFCIWKMLTIQIVIVFDRKNLLQAGKVLRNKIINRRCHGNSTWNSENTLFHSFSIVGSIFPQKKSDEMHETHHSTPINCTLQFRHWNGHREKERGR